MKVDELWVKIVFKEMAFSFSVLRLHKWEKELKRSSATEADICLSSAVY